MHRDDVIGLLFDKEAVRNGAIWRYVGNQKGMDYVHIIIRDDPFSHKFSWMAHTKMHSVKGVGRIDAFNEGESSSLNKAMLDCLDSFERAAAMINGASDG